MTEIVPRLVTEGATKIVLVLIDGLGGVRTDERGSELHAARTPNMDRLAREGSSGLHTVITPGVTSGSGAGHLAVFGYDPLVYELGRGALSAAGVGFPLKPGDVAARVNFCTLDANGNIADRRAGRIPTDENARLCVKILSDLVPPAGVEVFLETEREHRALLVLRGEGLSPHLLDTDPQVTGLPPRPPTATVPEAVETAAHLSDILAQVAVALQGEKANFLLLRGFDTLRELPLFPARYQLRAQGITIYPMYTGIARILGMDVTTVVGGVTEELEALRDSWADHDFFYFHHKKADSAGEDGDFDRKVAAIEEIDAVIPDIAALNPDVICITGDHATPSQLRSHSWHPVPFVLWGPRVGVDGVEVFDEEAARAGGYGSILGKDVMGLMLAGAARLIKYGA
ncbi:MAG: 2,3-bisphosphoglycerate-independent phosphoglycerate mutase [Actinobacteria bacterium]|nr:MAG: 2,3-bisphosphoglycerate-independent phosphoglycerate mutase [Actinomycetota bacterium]